MPTVSKDIASVIMAHNGVYPGDEACPPVVSITEYENAWGGEAYGITYEGQNNVYLTASQYVKNPKVVWRRTPPTTKDFTHET